MMTTIPDRSQLHAELLSIFESVRETPGASFQNEKMIHYLISNPDGKRNVHNSFKGKRYFLRFIRAVETHYGICFSNRDLETISGLTKMGDRVAYLRETPKSSLTVIANRLAERFNPNIIIVIALLSLPIVIAFYKTKSYLLLALLLGPSWIVAVIVYLERQERSHHHKLRDKIMEANKYSDRIK